MEDSNFVSLHTLCTVIIPRDLEPTTIKLIIESTDDAVCLYVVFFAWLCLFQLNVITEERSRAESDDLDQKKETTIKRVARETLNLNH